MNICTFIGNLTRDPEVRHTSGNSSVASFGLAVSRRFKTQSGEQREEVLFLDCEAWGRTGEVLAQHLCKGRQVGLNGRLALEQWDDKNGGGKRSKHKLVVESFQFINDGSKQSGAATERAAAPEPAGIDDDSLPF